ncbi:MAG: M6 family metalloprotease domain-containing protein [Bacteroidaceae bacterium]|nr:M6 family metalloprotease domain-containing protein [Bacteroidaceae bacterium]
MKIKTLLTVLCAVLCSVSGYSQGFQDIPRRGFPKDEYVQQSATRANGEYVLKNFLSTEKDTINVVIILAAFSDTVFSISEDSIRDLLSNRYNAEDYKEKVSFYEKSKAYGQHLGLEVDIPGSARDYFRDQSFGKFVPRFDVIGPVTLGHPRKYYGGNSNGNDRNTGGMISDACQKAFDLGLTDFTDYDNDDDGIVDIVYVVYAGSDEAQTDNAPNKTPEMADAVWAKASSISLILGNGMKISRYACSGELLMDLPVVAGIGTFVHEFSHVLGLPDFYNTKGADFTMDVWSVMDYGMYNAEGFVPCGYTAFERYSLGWIPMCTLERPDTMEIDITDKEKTGYRIFTSTTPADTASFYLMETIRKEGWNSWAPTEGLLISEVTYNKAAWTGNTVNAGTKHRYCIVPANNDYNYKTAKKHLFGRENDQFTLSSEPASITQFGAEMNKPLTEINYDKGSGITSFLFCGGSSTDEIAEISIQAPSIGVVYDLQGRMVENPSKGVYIRDGKKVLIK